MHRKTEKRIHIYCKYIWQLKLKDILLISHMSYNKFLFSFLSQGNDILHELTSHANHELKILLTDFNDITKFAEYTIFHVADEENGYKLFVYNYTGNAGLYILYQL